MAHFRGVVQGQRGEASRLGSQRLKTVAQAWGGQVCVTLWRETLGDTPGDYVHVYVEANDATYGDTGAKHTLYYGPLANLRKAGVGVPFTILPKGE
jgi:hypothetical protein